jgi:hypothetical protein
MLEMIYDQSIILKHVIPILLEKKQSTKVKVKALFA